ncbi:FAD/NAD(P)-binding domain-containing protein [Mytilinidion resinicola]|uniref:FAD/NAD(P)-binding domain-containing protein n=1 Tax=Mytilinidion resinicola TaxID=574789 RepID=A0A6A6YC01_9PEZI|nr:FAD/NAD(P)-binding domain-containing protein [Mytilinidion resinicola]KAF2805625.1 FAD/NAD(P)-binding domain-containing protein [Mytilinidion resinicola]
MGLSATRFFKHWPKLKEAYDSISLNDAWFEIRKHTGEAMMPAMPVTSIDAPGLEKGIPPGTFQMRPLVYKLLVNEAERIGINTVYNARVVDYFEDEGEGKAGAITEDGTRYTADVVIAADGVGSKSQKIVGGQVRAQATGRAMWRAAFPRKVLDEHPEVRDFIPLKDGKPIVRTWLGPSTYAITFTLKDLIVWTINHDATGSESESWNATIEADEVVKEMDKIIGPLKWSPMLRELVKCTPPKSIVNFELLWRDPQPTWSSSTGRIVQIGDAAHSYLPASANGATQAIEDAIHLASCLQIGGSKERVAQSIDVHCYLRFIRNACAQKMGFANVELMQNTKWDEAKIDPRRARPRLAKWIYFHDPEAYAYENYEKAVSGIKQGIPQDENLEIEPNFPKGYRYEAWSIEDIFEDAKNGKLVVLGSGDWN